MTTKEIIGKFFILGAAIEKTAQEDPEYLILQELSKDIQKVFLTNPEYLSFVKPLFDRKLLFANDKGDVLPSIGGWNKITPKTKFVKTMVSKPIEKMINDEVLNTFVESGFTICHRLQSDKILATKVNDRTADIQEMMECVVTSVNSALNVETKVEEELQPA